MASVEARNGAGAVLRPSCSQRTATSTMPSPRPPADSGRTTPSQPWSAMACHKVRSNPSARRPRSSAGPDPTYSRTRLGGRQAVEEIAGRVGQILLVGREFEFHRGEAYGPTGRPACPRRRHPTERGPVPPFHRGWRLCQADGDGSPDDRGAAGVARRAAGLAGRPTCPGSTGPAAPLLDDLAEEVAFGRHWQASWPPGGWVGVTWPEEYGGRGLGAARALRGAGGAGPGPGPRAGRPHRHQPGRPDPARPRHRRAEGPVAARASSRPSELWCQLFSEPDAGSDLASLTTRAATGRRAGGGSTARRSGPPTPSSPTGACAWPAATPTPPSSSRASPCLVVDMHAAGVEVRPLVQSPARPSSTRSSSTTCSSPTSS